MFKKMAIITGYCSGDTHGVLGPQMAATIIARDADCQCIVVVSTREECKADLEAALVAYFGSQPPLVGFSAIGGRDDLVALAGRLKENGAVTVLAGPQADVDFVGETQWQRFPHRFKGFSSAFSFALHGPAEQFIGFAANPSLSGIERLPGAVYRTPDGGFGKNPQRPWPKADFRRVDWHNVVCLKGRDLVPFSISAGQVLQQIGCPYAAKARTIAIDYPAFLPGSENRRVRLEANGCSFCDVAIDKGFHGRIDADAVLDQIDGLPNGIGGRKIPFELINENPLFGLPKLMAGIAARNTRISRINLTMRADWMLRGERYLREALSLAKQSGVQIALTSMGFEAFDEDLLRNLNKGVTLATNLDTVALIRRLKAEFGEHWGYLHNEGGNHGFIHPTPWDTPQRAARMERIFQTHGLPRDILPAHSTPLIIHHASRLGDWIREIETRENIRFQRYGSIIGWWQIGDRCIL